MRGRIRTLQREIIHRNRKKRGAVMKMKVIFQLNNTIHFYGWFNSEECFIKDPSNQPIIPVRQQLVGNLKSSNWISPFSSARRGRGRGWKTFYCFFNSINLHFFYYSLENLFLTLWDLLQKHVNLSFYPNNKKQQYVINKWPIIYLL
ncbi:hypothetical protein V8G54_004618 [Vigna mungo]|uniref:Uncharacterized protein n=1 Tax=Vigna mungo TaxID=3915 RepID=A0AAQ3SG34_VIGMU